MPYSLEKTGYKSTFWVIVVMIWGLVLFIEVSDKVVVHPTKRENSSLNELIFVGMPSISVILLPVMILFIVIIPFPLVWKLALTVCAQIVYWGISEVNVSL